MEASRQNQKDYDTYSCMKNYLQKNMNTCVVDNNEGWLCMQCDQYKTMTNVPKPTLLEV